jgi:hypothetical protein
LFLFLLDHTQTHTTVGRTPLDEGSARRRDLYLTTQTLTRDKHPCPPVGFKPTIPASARPQTYALTVFMPARILIGTSLYDLGRLPPVK